MIGDAVQPSGKVMGVIPHSITTQLILVPVWFVLVLNLIKLTYFFLLVLFFPQNLYLKIGRQKKKERNEGKQKLLETSWVQVGRERSMELRLQASAEKDLTFQNCPLCGERKAGNINPMSSLHLVKRVATQ